MNILHSSGKDIFIWASEHFPCHSSLKKFLFPWGIGLMVLTLLSVKVCAQTSQVIGYWTFEGKDLSAQVGQALKFANAETEAASHFGTTSGLTPPNIHGQSADILFAPGLDHDLYGFLMPVPDLSNGGGSMLNDYTLVFDIYWLESHADYRSFIQIDHPENSNDGEFFLHDGGIGVSGHYVGKVNDKQWHRIAFAVTPDRIDKYVDGILVGSQNGGGIDGRFALRSGEEALLFGDNSGEVGEAYVASIQLRDRSMHYAEMAVLGKPDAEGISTETMLIESVEGPVLGQWDFTDGDFSPTIGKPLDAPDAATLQQTQFGTTSSLGLPPINGHAAHVMRAPGLDSATYGYHMPIPFAPNGGGDHLNVYTLLVDILWPESDKGYRSFIQIDDLTNDNDGEFFIRQSGSIGVSGDYDGEMEPDTWYRVGFVVTPETILKYINGVLVGEQSGDGIDGRFAFRTSSHALLFADDSGETDVAYLSSIQLQNKPLTADELKALGSPDHRGIGGSLPPVVESRTIVRAEYFIDTDPGQGLGTPLLPGDGAFDDHLETVSVSELNLSDLTPGIHTLFVRYMDSEDQWSAPISQEFTYACEMQTRHIVAAEWFIDTDPGPGNAMPISATDGMFDSALETVELTEFHLEGLEPGTHTLFVRYMNNESQWSDTITSTFFYECGPQTILAAEYFIDQDPGEGMGIHLDALDGSFDSSQETVSVENVMLSSLKPGPHMVYVRYFDSAGNWSAPLETSFVYQCDNLDLPIQILHMHGEDEISITFPERPGRVFVWTTPRLDEAWTPMEAFPELTEDDQMLKLRFSLDEDMRFFRIEFR